jgi:hypothetical protein
MILDENSCRWDMKELHQLKDCYHDFARFMFGTMIEIEKALPKDIARRNTDVIREIVGFQFFFLLLYQF